jgi:hypothetical protein
MLIKVAPTRVTEVFISEEPIGNLAAVYISTGGRSVKEGDSTTQHLIGGVALGSILSGKLTRVVTLGIVSGVICGAVVSAGDRVACTNVTSGGGLASGKGKITPINTITPAGTISRVSGSLLLASGLMTSGAISGHVGVEGTSLINAGGLVSGITGFLGEIPSFTGTAFNTARVLGKVLDNGGIGSGVRLLVIPGG